MNNRIIARTGIIGLLFTIMFQFQPAAQDISPVRSCDFSEINSRTTVDPQISIANIGVFFFEQILN